MYKTKPYFSTGNFWLFHGDSIKIMQEIPDNHVDMIFADPPYMLSNNGFSCQNGQMVSVNKGKWDKSNGFDNDLNFHETRISECRRILKPEGTIRISGTYHSIYQCGFLLQKLGFHILNDICWFKPNASPNLSCRFFTASHETVIRARKDKKSKHVFNYDAMKNGLFPNDMIKKPGLQMRSLWSIHPPAKEEKKFGKHPTQKPLNLLTRIIKSSTNNDALILDPFNGGGTTGIATQMTGGNRKYIGIDLEEQYLKLTIQRHDDLLDKGNQGLNEVNEDQEPKVDYTLKKELISHNYSPQGIITK